MKQLFLILVLLPITLFAQKQTGKIAPVDTTVYNVVEKMPEYPGGMKTLAHELMEYSLNYMKGFILANLLIVSVVGL